MPVLGLGTNVGDRLGNLASAIHKLQHVLNDIHVSPIYESEALLLPGSPQEWNVPYYNIALQGRTNLSPTEMLAEVKRIEHEVGRKDRGRWAPREIDIDILTWGRLTVDLPDLKIPHCGLLERAFALLPLLDVAPNFPAGICPALISQAKRAPGNVQADFRSSFSDMTCKFCIREHPRAEIVGILNVTPDSFSDGGKFVDPMRAVEAAIEMGAKGASVIDIGAESTRPGAAALSADEEWVRLEPVLRGLRNAAENGRSVPKFGVDTRNSDVARRALVYGITWINDVTGFDSDEMIEAVLDSEVDLICMHHLSVPVDAKVHIPIEEDPVEYVKEWAAKRITKLTERGISEERIIFDPGIGFGKTAEQSWKLIAGISTFNALGVRTLVGHSRKSFLGQITDRPPVERDAETAALSVFLAQKGVQLIRVHNVEVNYQLLKSLQLLAE